ncbi:uncharacterized protein LOC131887013 isoform X2 [Tigriopus californicus]|uniref:uncharacterized protein LOC131887013 isoform X2 n=1 Tax=Tigriopus californicus TaxID=6832 RepID=UPI0027DA5BF2|nr:uncharacterized protein LOC131887013 isoform X2 [Tigriopus californicus]
MALTQPTPTVPSLSTSSPPSSPGSAIRCLRMASSMSTPFKPKANRVHQFTKEVQSDTPIMMGSHHPFPGSRPVQVLEPSRFITKHVYLLPREPMAYPGTQRYVRYPKDSVVLPKSLALPFLARHREMVGPRTHNLMPIRSASPYTSQRSPNPVTSPRISQEEPRKKTRTIFTDYQCQYLKSVFNKSQYLTKEARAQVAKTIGVLDNTVDVSVVQEPTK